MYIYNICTSIYVMLVDMHVYIYNNYIYICITYCITSFHEHICFKGSLPSLMIKLLCRKSTTSGTLGFESMWSDSRGKITHQLGMKCALSPCMGLFPFFRFQHPPNISTTSKYVLTSHFQLVEFDDISTTSKYQELFPY